MGIQSRLVTAEGSPEPSYPYLARYAYEGSPDRPVPSRRQFVVLFLEGSKGVVVQASEDAKWPLGYSCAAWMRDCFEPLNGEITLRNA